MESVPTGLLPSPASNRLLLAAQHLAAARDLGRVMEVVRRAARDLTRADGVTFVLREGDLVHYADEEAISEVRPARARYSTRRAPPLAKRARHPQREALQV